jgi:hypothetical protein
LQALVGQLQQDAYKFPDRIAEFKVQSQSAGVEQPPAAVESPPSVPGAQVLGLPHGVVQVQPSAGAPSAHDLLLSPRLLQHQQQPLSEAALEDVLQSASAAHQLDAAEPWFPSFGAGGFDARDPFDVQFGGGSQPCGLLLSSTGARL